MINEKLRDEIARSYYIVGGSEYSTIVKNAINEYARRSAEQNAAALTFKDGAEWAEQVCRAVGRRLSQGAGYACNIAADEIKDQLSVINAAPPIPTAMGWPAPSQEGVGQGEPATAAAPDGLITREQIQEIETLLDMKGIDKKRFLMIAKVKSVDEIRAERFDGAISWLDKQGSK